MAGATPTKRSLDECKKRGWLAHVVEKWCPVAGKWPGKRVDAFGFGDVLAVELDAPGATLIQATTTQNAPARVTKICEECREAATAWLLAGNRILVWGWAKRGAEGKRKLWTLKEYPVTLETLGYQKDESNGKHAGNERV